MIALDPPRTSSKSKGLASNSVWPYILLLLIPGVITYVILLHFATSFPIADDFTGIVEFASNFHKATGPTAKLSTVLFSQAGPYKLVLLQGLVALELLTLGHLNFSVLIFLGNLSLAGIFVVLAKNTNLGSSTKGSRWLILLPVGLLLFGVTYAETVDWALTGMQHPPGIFFALVTFHFLVKSPRQSKNFALACLFAAFAVSTNASGLLVFPVGLLFLLLRHKTPNSAEPNARRSVFPLIVWSGLMVVFTLFYLFRMNTTSMTGRASLATKALFVLMFSGGNFENMHHRPVPYLSVLIGSFVLVTFALSVRSRYYRTHPFFFLIMLWLLATAVTVANGRAHVGLHLSLSGRYKIYCVMLLICCYEYFLDRRLDIAASSPSSITAEANFQKRFLTPVILATTVMFFFSEAMGAKFLATRRERTNNAESRYLTSGGLLSPQYVVSEHWGPDDVAMEETGRQQLNEAVALGVYILPKR
jgi:hypothetical protein